MSRTHVCLALVVGIAAGVGAVPQAVSADERAVSFNRDIAPILAGKCFACHGPDQRQRKADLRLDDAAAAKKSGVLVATDSQVAEIIARITSSDPEQQMPPAASKKPRLTTDEVALLKRWVSEGAKYDAHWAFVKPERYVSQEPKDPAWGTNDIDRFIAAAHAAHDLQPSPEAEKRTLLRRLSMDLIGLPPTPADVAAFAADGSPEAYEKAVDRLLGSKHFGERMAVYWLDVVRYADSAGYHSDNVRNVTPYRDYVIHAFNDNKPFDQFVREQIAGDLIPNATMWQKVGSGYNRLLQTTEEGGAQAKEYTAKYAADRARNFGSAFLALTTGCCECHDHKFDPLTTRDFYGLEAFFADIQESAVGRREPGMPVPSEEQEAELARLATVVTGTQQELEAAVQLAVEGEPDATSLAAASSRWQTANIEKANVQGESKLVPQDDGALQSEGKVATQETYELMLHNTTEVVAALRLEALADDRLPAKGPGAAPNGNFVLTEVKVAVIDKDNKERAIKIVKAIASHSQAGHDIATAFDGNGGSGWAVLPQVGRSHEAIFQLAESLPATDGSKLKVTLEFRSQYPQHNIGRLRLSTTTNSDAVDGWVSAEMRGVLAKLAKDRTAEEKQQLAKYYRERAPQTQGLRTMVQQAIASRQKFEEAIPKSLISISGPPRQVRILPRGNWLDDSGPLVEPAPPAFLGDFAVKDRRPTRLDLADWLLSAEQPLTSRVFVNRVWKLLFGRGLNKSVEDFGTQGEYPSHPELLDTLAVEFRESGWDIKRLIRQIVMTRTYRQSSLASQTASEKDPANIWLARQSRFRFEAENVRDNALAVSGLLVEKIGGPSVFPYQPAGYWSYLNFPTREWQNDSGEGLYRRGLYTHWQRSFLHPSLVAFDAPSREECTVDRPRSNTPLQALVLLNDPTYVEAARALAAKTMASAGDTPARLEEIFQQALQRSPRDEERKTLTALYDKQLREYSDDATAATALMSEGVFKSPENLKPAELAAWTNVARVVLNLHESVTRN